MQRSVNQLVRDSQPENLGSERCFLGEPASFDVLYLSEPLRHLLNERILSKLSPWVKEWFS